MYDEIGDDSTKVTQASAGPVHHVALRVADPVTSLAFYSGLLGFPEVRRFAAPGGVRSVWVRAGDAVLMLEREIRGAGASAGSGHVLVFEVDDLEDWAARLTLAGRPPVERTESTLYVSDPDGHRVGLTAYPRKTLLAPAL